MTFDTTIRWGGSPRLDSPTYIFRQADGALYEALLSGEYCYVFNSRQMGESSLRMRSQERLKAAGKLCASINMTGIGSEGVTPLQLRTILDRLSRNEKAALRLLGIYQTILIAVTP